MRGRAGGWRAPPRLFPHAATTTLMPPQTYYDRLGVPPDAPLDAIAAAFRERALLLHPDVEGG